MDSESPSTFEPQQSTLDQTASPLPVPAKPKLIAPLWHTLLVVALILVTSYTGSVRLPGGGARYSRFLLYGETAVMELIFCLIIWFGIRRKGVTMRELIGGRWNKPEDFLIDLGIGIAFWVVAVVFVVAGLKIALGLVDLHNPNASLEQMKQALGPLIPRNGTELGLFLSLTMLAGLFEEIIFRGYLLKQFSGIFGNVYAGVFASGILFGAAHGYQGLRLMALIAVLGVMFGLLAVWRKSLRPGMIAHAWTDAISGIVLYFFS